MIIKFGVPGEEIIDIYCSREPDLVLGEDGESVDANADNYSKILGFNSPKEMADDIVENYTETYESIKKYKGFYVGRYELTGTVDTPTVQKGKAVIVNQNWYNLYNACKNVISTNYAQTTMISGNEWDEIMSWLLKTGSKSYEEINNDSRSWGNYKELSLGIKESGFNDSWKANNIFDLAGNCWEETLEVAGFTGHLLRGGSFWTTGVDADTVASGRHGVTSESTHSHVSSRPALYIK